MAYGPKIPGSSWAAITRANFFRPKRGFSTHMGPRLAVTSSARRRAATSSARRLAATTGRRSTATASSRSAAARKAWATRRGRAA